MLVLRHASRVITTATDVALSCLQMAFYEGKQIPSEKLSLKKDCMTKNYPSKKLALENNIICQIMKLQYFKF